MKKKVVGIIITIVVFLGAGGAGAYFYMTNTPKNKYLLSEKKSYEALDEYFTKRYEKEIELQKKISEESYKSNVTLNVEASQRLLDTFGIAESMVNSSKLEFSAAHDPKNNTSKIAINPTIDNEKIGELAWSADKDYQFIEAPVLDEPLKMKNNAIVKGIEKLTGESFSADEDVTNDALNLNTLLGSSVNKEKIDDISSHYFRFILEEINEDNFKKSEGSVEVLGKKEKLDTVTLTLSDKETKELVLATLEEMKKDKDIKALVKESDATIDYKKEVSNLIKEAKKETNYPTIKSVIYVDGKEIKKREMTIKLDEDEVNVAIDTKIDKDIDMKFVAGSSNSDEEMTIKGSSKGEGTVKDKYEVAIADLPVFTFTNEEKLKGSKRTNAMNFAISGENADEEFDINYEQTMTTTDEKQTAKGTVSFDFENETIKFNIDTNTKLNEALKVDIPQAVDVNNMSDSDVEQLGETVSNNLMSLLYGGAYE